MFDGGNLRQLEHRIDSSESVKIPVGENGRGPVLGLPAILGWIEQMGEGVPLRINHQEIAGSENASVFERAAGAGIHVPTSCNGKGTCRECLVEVTAGMEFLTPRTDEEKHLKDRYRLACRSRVLPGEGLVECHTLRRSAMRIVQEGKLRPAGAAAFDPAVRRDGNYVLLDGEAIDERSGPLLGLAVDVGTTTAVVRLVDLETGSVRAFQAFENPQRFAGSDVMSRIYFDGQHPGRLLRRVLLGYLGRAIEDFGCCSEDIYEVVVAGNTTMRDLFFGLDVHGIGQRPFRSTTEEHWRSGKVPTTSVTLPGKRSLLPVHPKARVYGLPLVGSHVGADAAACLLTVDLLSEERTVALMDIGTNSELFMGNRRALLAASCPAGPAFEGGSVTHGMPALDGAIEAVSLSPKGVEFRVIGESEAEGLCGSGLVELLGELLRTGRMNDRGRLVNGDSRFAVTPDGRVFLSEADISALAQAKGANAVGMNLLARRLGIDFPQLDHLYLCGAFAKHLNLSAARRIGLIPDLPDEKITQLGNAAIEGATQALLSVSKRQELESFVQSIEHIELESDPNFFDAFVEGCLFHPILSTRLE